MSWKRKFTDPVPLPDGGRIRTLSEARAYMLMLTERRQLEERWQYAAQCVLSAATKRIEDTDYFARPALYAAIYPSDNRLPPAPDIKKADTWRERRRARISQKS
jgi:hypothetical protein